MTGRKRQSPGAVALRLDIHRNLQRIKPSPQKSPTLTRCVHDVVKDKGESGMRNFDPSVLPQITQTGSEARIELIDRRELFSISVRRWTSGQSLGGSRIVQPIVMMHASNQRAFVHHARHVWKMLADKNSGGRRGNRLKLTAHVGRGSGLHVIGVKMARTTIVKDDDARFDRRYRSRGQIGFGSEGPSGLGSQKPAKSQSKSSARPLKSLTTVHPSETA